MKSIIPDGEYPVCYLSGRSDNLEIHHVFEGNPGRKLSERYGLKVWLTQEMHTGENGVHQNRKLSDRLKAEIQQKAMEYYGWSIEQFRHIFGKSYI